MYKDTTHKIGLSSVTIPQVLGPTKPREEKLVTRPIASGILVGTVALSAVVYAFAPRSAGSAVLGLGGLSVALAGLLYATSEPVA